MMSDILIDADLEAQKIIDLFKGPFLNDQGFVSRSNPPSSRTIFDNFDDIVPFLIHFGELDFLLAQTQKLDTQAFETLLPIGNVLYSYKIDEYLGGLNQIHRVSQDAHVDALMVDAIEKCQSYFLDDNHHFAEFYDFRSHKRSPYFTPWAAGLLETFLELSDRFPALLDTVSNIMDVWCDHWFFQEYGLFPARGSVNSTWDRINAFPAKFGQWSDEYPQTGEPEAEPQRLTLRSLIKKIPFVYDVRRLKYLCITSGNWVRLMKCNTTPVFTMIELYRKTGDDKWKARIHCWIEAARQNLVQADGVHGRFHPGRGNEPASLVDSFILIDVLCDAWWHADRNPEYLDLAKSIAEACLKWSPDTLTIPTTPNGDRDHLDAQVDFSIALRRVGELSEDATLKDRSSTLMANAIKAHQTGQGLCTHVKMDGTQVQASVNMVDPKYNGLALKGLIHLQTIDQSIYGDPKLMDLFKDR